VPDSWSERARPRFGAVPREGGTAFTVWAPVAARVDVKITPPRGGRIRSVSLKPDADRIFTGFVPSVGAGYRYGYSLDKQPPLPDPASRFQPAGVHGLSEIIAPFNARRRRPLSAVSLADAVLYELHVGTFSPEGTFMGALKRLPHLAELGVTTISLMPLAAFAGERGWGYDGVSLFAPARCYGRPEHARKFVQRAHALGIGVVLDVVFNHIGPDGNYLDAFAPHFFAKSNHTPWGPTFNLDGSASSIVREFLIQSAVHWVTEYGMDGLRLDAVQFVHDSSTCHFLEELAARVRASSPDRELLLLAEGIDKTAWTHRKRRKWHLGFDAIWSEQLHHECRRFLTAEAGGYLKRATGTIEGLVRSLKCRKPAAIHYLQTHDLIGNRLDGRRFHHSVPAAAWRAATALLLLSPDVPLLFMGQEWAADTPFYFFSDHNQALGEHIRAGREKQFAEQLGHQKAATSTTPDPQSYEAFLASRLDWSELNERGHRQILQMHRDLLALRKLVSSKPGAEAAISAVGRNALLLLQPPGTGVDGFASVFLLKNRKQFAMERLLPKHVRCCECLFESESEKYCIEPHPIGSRGNASCPVVIFNRPGAVVFRLESRSPTLCGGCHFA
jgi:maltooligosyltrehalose trehalohydrolase